MNRRDELLGGWAEEEGGGGVRDRQIPKEGVREVDTEL